MVERVDADQAEAGKFRVGQHKEREGKGESEGNGLSLASRETARRRDAFTGPDIPICRALV
jgi:hypothetical protein